MSGVAAGAGGRDANVGQLRSGFAASPWVALSCPSMRTGRRAACLSGGLSRPRCAPRSSRRSAVSPSRLTSGFYGPGGVCTAVGILAPIG